MDINSIPNNSVPPSQPVQPIQSPMPNAPQEPPPQNNPKFFSRKILIIGGVLFVVILITIPIILALKKSKPGASTSTTNTQKPILRTADILLAKVGDDPIYKSMVLHVAEEQYAPHAINNDVLKRFLDIVIERKILDQEAKRENITVLPNEINEHLAQYHLKENSTINARYEILKEKIMLGMTQNVTANTISFWVRPYSGPDPQTQENIQQRIDGIKALKEALPKLQKGEDSFSITQAIFNTHPILQSLLALNGRIFGKSDKVLMQQAYTFNINETHGGKKVYDVDIISALTGIKPGDVKLVIKSDGTGANLIKCLTVQNGQYATYSNFISAKKNELVKMINPV